MDEVDKEYLRFLRVIDNALDHANQDKIISEEDFKFAQSHIDLAMKRERKAHGQ
jgi:hypothetical protein